MKEREREGLFLIFKNPSYIPEYNPINFIIDCTIVEIFVYQFRSYLLNVKRVSWPLREGGKTGKRGKKRKEIYGKGRVVHRQSRIIKKAVEGAGSVFPLSRYFRHPCFLYLNIRVKSSEKLARSLARCFFTLPVDVFAEYMRGWRQTRQTFPSNEFSSRC